MGVYTACNSISHNPPNPITTCIQQLSNIDCVLSLNAWSLHLQQTYEFKCAWWNAMALLLAACCVWNVNTHLHMGWHFNSHVFDVFPCGRHIIMPHSSQPIRSHDFTVICDIRQCYYFPCMETKHYSSTDNTLQSKPLSGNCSAENLCTMRKCVVLYTRCAVKISYGPHHSLGITQFIVLYKLSAAQLTLTLMLQLAAEVKCLNLSIKTHTLKSLFFIQVSDICF